MIRTTTSDFSPAGPMSPISLLAAIVPVFCGLLGAVLSNLPVSLTGGLVPGPLLALMPVYFWCLVRPDLMPVAAAFAVGLCQDLLSGSPPGFSTASFIVTYALLDRNRESFASLAGIGAILGFALAALVATGTVTFIAWLYFLHRPPLTPLVLQLVASVLWYVPALPVLNWIQRNVVGALRTEF
jgi:rod shape-determining protein MreD